MMTTDYRAGLKRLVNAADDYAFPSVVYDEFYTAVEAARALLATPEAVEDTKGLHGKYIIHRSSDGSPVEFQCFVLRLDGKDPAAMAAIRAYCENPACPPELRNDIQIQFGWRQAWKAAAPEAVGVADEEILRLASKTLGYVHIRADAKELEADAGELIAFARALLSRYGTAHPAPVPVDERPWERDGWGDAKGMCWLSEKGTLCDPPAWAFVHKARLIDAASYPSGAESLPHWALPLPGVE